MPLNSLQLGCGDKRAWNIPKMYTAVVGTQSKVTRNLWGGEECQEGFLGETVLQVSLEKDRKS